MAIGGHARATSVPIAAFGALEAKRRARRTTDVAIPVGAGGGRHKAVRVLGVPTHLGYQHNSRLLITERHEIEYL